MFTTHVCKSVCTPIRLTIRMANLQFPLQSKKSTNFLNETSTNNIVILSCLQGTHHHAWVNSTFVKPLSLAIRSPSKTSQSSAKYALHLPKLREKPLIYFPSPFWKSPPLPAEISLLLAPYVFNRTQSTSGFFHITSTSTRCFVCPPTTVLSACLYCYIQPLILRHG